MLILDEEENIRLFFSLLSDDKAAIAQTSPAAFLLVRVYVLSFKRCSQAPACGCVYCSTAQGQGQPSPFTVNSPHG